MSLCDLLSQAWAGPTLAAIVGVLLSFLQEYIPIDKWPPKFKRLFFLGLCIVVCVAAWFLAPVAGCVRPEWSVLVMAILAAFGAGTAIHTRKL